MKFITLLTLAVALLPTTALAQSTYRLLAPLGPLTGDVTLTGYLEGIMMVIIGVAGILAVVMIVICGIQMIGSPSVSQKSASKTCITNAIFGLILAFSSWLVLNTINTQLLSSDATLLGLPGAAPASPGATPVGNYAWSTTAGSCDPIAGRIVSTVPNSYCSGTPSVANAPCCGYINAPVRPPTGTTPTTPRATTSPLSPIPPPTPPGPTSGGVTFSSGDLLVLENAGFATLVVTRSSGNAAGTVDYTVAPGSATSGLDFSTVSGTLTFPQGVASLTITVPILNDTLVERREDFVVTLSNTTGGLRPGPYATKIYSTKRVVIVSDDLDTIFPTIIIQSPATGTVTTSPSFSARVVVTEETELISVSMHAQLSVGGKVTYKQQICTASTPCPPLGNTWTVLTSFGAKAKSNEYYDFVAKACDAANNCAYATTTIGHTEACLPGTRLLCDTIPSGASLRSTLVLSGTTSANLIKINTPAGGGTISVTTAAAPFFPQPPGPPGMCGTGVDVVYCNYGCSNAATGGCIPPPAGPPGMCGTGVDTTYCEFGCDPFTFSCIPNPDPCDYTICPQGCDYSSGSIPAACFTPQPVVVATLAVYPGDLSITVPCGNSGAVETRSVGQRVANILFGGTGNPLTTCILKPLFNYYLNVGATDGRAHNFVVRYNWLP